jgi:glucose/arabinose dehydrogenase
MDKLHVAIQNSLHVGSAGLLESVRFSPGLERSATGESVRTEGTCRVGILFSGMSPNRRHFLALLGGSLLAGCSSEAGSPGTDTPTATTPPRDSSVAVVDDDYDHPLPSADPDWRPAGGSPAAADLEVETLVENLEVPWDLSFTPDGELFLTERTGSVLRFESGEVSPVVSPEEAIDAGALEPGSDEQPWFVEGGEGGTLGIAAHPTYPDPSWVYVYYTTDAGGRRNRVVRYDATADDPAGTREVVIDSIPADQNIHHGGRIEFGPDDNLWVLTGDANQSGRVSDLDFLGGKVLRVTPDGAAPSSNPFVDRDDADPRIFTYGHRNPQGIAWLPSGVPVATEHGPAARDEVNVLVPGGNYGWDVARGGPNDDEYDSYAAHDEYEPPVVNTDTTWAPSGALFYTGDAVPAWRNRMLIGSLAAQRLVVVTLTPASGELPPTDGENARRFDAPWLEETFTGTAHGLLGDELGRIRHVEQGPDGQLYAITSNRDGRADGRFPTERDDRLVRLSGA